MEDRDPTAKWRIFSAVELPAATRERLQQHISRLQAMVPDVRASWSRVANIHLTLKFLGDIPKASVANFERAVASATTQMPPFKVLIAETGVFPHRRDPRVLWIGVNDVAGQLQQLHARLERECEEEGFPRDTRRFHPHLTLARLRDQQRARELTRVHEELEFAAEEIDVSEVLVIRSELNSAGSKYTILSRHPLRG